MYGKLRVCKTLIYIIHSRFFHILTADVCIYHHFCLYSALGALAQCRGGGVYGIRGKLCILYSYICYNKTDIILTNRRNIYEPHTDLFYN